MALALTVSRYLGVALTLDVGSTDLGLGVVFTAPVVGGRSVRAAARVVRIGDVLAGKTFAGRRVGDGVDAPIDARLIAAAGTTDGDERDRRHSCDLPDRRGGGAQTIE